MKKQYYMDINGTYVEISLKTFNDLLRAMNQWKKQNYMAYMPYQKLEESKTRIIYGCYYKSTNCEIWLMCHEKKDYVRKN